MNEDQSITCRDCNTDFEWSSGEQTFYAEKGLSAPTRCRDCRKKRRAEREQGGGGFKSDRPTQSYDIICSQCQKPGTVPFEPKRDDVLCRECFMASKGSGDNKKAE